MFYGLSVFLFHLLFRLSGGKDTREFHAIFQHLPRAFQRQRAAGVRHRVGAASRRRSARQPFPVVPGDIPEIPPQILHVSRTADFIT